MLMRKHVISASRRTDLPWFYYEWLQGILAKGRVEVANPRFPEKIYQVDLQPENVHSLVLWSKNFANVFCAPGRLADYNLYFQYTINNYSRFLEPSVPEYHQSIRTLDGLLKRYRPDQFNIRFDPIILSTLGEFAPTKDKPGQARLDAFESLCRDLAALGMQNCRVTTSYVALYSHVRKRLAAAGGDIIPLDASLQTKFFARMAEIASRYGVRLFACASPGLVAPPAILPGRCIDGELLEALFGGKVSKARDGGQRKACGCHKSVDIGDYHKGCLGGCLYCYATTTQAETDGDSRRRPPLINC